MDAGQATIREILFEKLNDGKARNASFSIRALARQVGVQPGALSEVLAGKRRISPKLAERITQKLGIPPDKRHEILEKFPSKSAGKNSTPDRSRLILDADKHALVADWFHFAILSLLETENSKSNPRWIATRLGIPELTAKLAIRRLERIGLITRKNNRLILNNISISSPDQKPNEALRHVHRKNLNLAEQSLDEVGIDQRDFSAVTLAINPGKIPEAKAKIRKFLTEMEQLLEVHPQKEVFKLCVQLFPLTKLDKD